MLVGAEYQGNVRKRRGAVVRIAQLDEVQGRTNRLLYDEEDQKKAACLYTEVVHSEVVKNQTPRARNEKREKVNSELGLLLAFLFIIPLLLLPLLFEFFSVSNNARHDWFDGWSFWENVSWNLQRSQRKWSWYNLNRSRVAAIVLQKYKREGRLKALNFLGATYAQGVGVSQNYKKALYLFQGAANRGYPEAQCNIGLMYEHGLGVSKNRSEAAFWYGKAWDGGFEPALVCLKRTQTF